MKHIFLAEDDFGIQDIITLVLQRLGYTVTVYMYGKQLIANMTQIPDLYLLDNQLPDMNGTDICRFLKQQDSSKSIPVIMVSANPNIASLATQAGADDYLEKPFTIKDLKLKVEFFCPQGTDNGGPATDLRKVS